MTKIAADSHELGQQADEATAGPSVFLSECVAGNTTAAASNSLARRIGRIVITSASPMMPTYPSLPPAEREQVESQMEVFLVRQIFSMPRYLLVPFVIALLAFEVLPLLTAGHAFSRLPEERRARIVDSWANSRISQKRDLIKLIRNCALYFYLDHPLVRARLESGEGASGAL